MTHEELVEKVAQALASISTAIALKKSIVALTDLEKETDT
jgi:hypothetical protein